MGDLPKRVLHVHNNADLYGASRMLLRWIQSVDRRRFEPLVVIPEEGPLKERLEAERVEVVLHRRLSVLTRPALRSWRVLLFWLNYPVSVAFLWRLIRSRQVDLVYSNTGVMVSSPVAAWLAGVPHVWHVRESFQEFRSTWPLFARFMRMFSDEIVAVSHPIAGQFPSHIHPVVIHDGFSADEFNVPRETLRLEFRARYGLDRQFVVGCVGRIKWVRKGQEFLVEATALLKKRGITIRALIVGVPFPGNEDHLERLRSLIGRLGIGNQVVLTGELADPRGAYSAMDVLTLTSAQPEPFGNVVMEAMGMGLPVIATAIGGSLDQVLDGVTGYLVPPANAEALADAIEKLMRHPELRLRMGQAGCDRVRTRFSLEQMTSQIEQLFETILQRKRGHGSRGPRPA